MAGKKTLEERVQEMMIPEAPKWQLLRDLLQEKVRSMLAAIIWSAFVVYFLFADFCFSLCSPSSRLY